MISCLKYDPMLDSGYFYADTKAELANLPNMVDNGKFELANMNSINAGSRCICQEDKYVYILNGQNQWVIYRSSEGGGGGGGADWPDGYEDVDIDFDNWPDVSQFGSGSGSGSGSGPNSGSSGNSSDDDEEETEDIDFSGF